MKKERIGILGGTFDPVHLGHAEAARLAREAMGLERVILLPSSDPPHKQCRVSKADRLRMTRLLATEREGLSVSGMEIARPGKTYTVDTLRALLAEDPAREIVYIIGLDTLFQLTKWREFESVAGMCTFLVVGRPGSDAEEDCARELKENFGARIVLLSGSGPDISSTAIRALAGRRRDVTPYTGEAVARHIRENGLYLMNMPFEAAVERLRAMLKPSRFLHTQGVVETAEELARRFGEDVPAARVAALLHDAAKCLPFEEMLSLAEGTDADEMEIRSPELLHSVASYALAGRDFGVTDEEILRAVRTHTLGEEGMSRLQKIIYLADYIEPHRKMFEGLETVREEAKKDLDRACRLAAEGTVRHLTSQGLVSHPRMLKWLNNGR